MSDTTSPAASPTITLTDEDNGKNIKLPNGGTVLVELRSNPSTGYGWSYLSDVNSQTFGFTLTSFEHATDGHGGAGGAVGVGGVDQCLFTVHGAVNMGGWLRLFYQRSWTETFEPASTWQVKIAISG